MNNRVLGLCAALVATLALACSDTAPVGSSAGGAANTGGDASSTGAGGMEPDLLPPSFVSTWGQLGTAPGEFVEPSSVEVDATGNVYVAGHEDRLQKFTADGALLDIFGSAGVGDGQFNHPHGLAMDRAAGLLYAGDQNNGRVQVFTTDGTFVRLWSDPQFQHIHDVGIDPLSGDIFVGDFESDIVQRFTDIGVPVLEFGGPGTGDGAFAGAWGISTDSEGRVYVSDTGNQRVQIFSATGAFLDQWNGFSKPTGVFVDPLDRVYVCDSTAAEVHIFDVAGTPLAVWDIADIVGSPSEPEDIVISTDGAHIYLGDVLQHRVIHLVRQDGS